MDFAAPSFVADHVAPPNLKLVDRERDEKIFRRIAFRAEDADSDRDRCGEHKAQLNALTLSCRVLRGRMRVARRAITSARLPPVWLCTLTAARSALPRRVKRWAR
jgi:hypothetical protein